MNIHSIVFYSLLGSFFLNDSLLAADQPFSRCDERTYPDGRVSVVSTCLAENTKQANANIFDLYLGAYIEKRPEDISALLESFRPYISNHEFLYQAGTNQLRKGNSVNAIADLVASTEAGSSKAPYLLFYLYSKEGEREKAIRALTIAAERRHSGAEFQLSALLLEGLDVRRDTSLALKYLRDAAEQGEHQALQKLYEYSDLLPVPERGNWQLLHQLYYASSDGELTKSLQAVGDYELFCEFLKKKDALMDGVWSSDDLAGNRGDVLLFLTIKCMKK
ncbi:sel1 repeat family protein [Permianibacter sp. IMCC34836]|uniref:tetratricopeptide repeat protein n=1 Tax=Permianibacter fluminis TaxID=2738515 RepID=UPI001556F921|nr:sel1 repeat family protein [Permianibacter fluminis]NQD37532.1 sel1 repeat family protein [Permianibacter fluminis]